MYALLLTLLMTSSFFMVYKTACLFYTCFCKKRFHKTIYIIRGLPGSGKKTLIKKWLKHNKLLNKNECYCICSADKYFVENKTYKFNPRELPKAYNDCLNRFINCLIYDVPYIFINNPNAQLWEYENYILLAKQYGYKVRVKEINCPGDNYVEYFNKRSKYNVPLTSSYLIYERWEDDPLAEMIEPYEMPFEGDSLPYPKKTKEELDTELDEFCKKRDLLARKWTIVDDKDSLLEREPETNKKQD